MTGGAGFLGIEVTGAILESGGDVLSLDIVQAPPEEHWSETTLDQGIQKRMGTDPFTNI